MRPPPCLPLPPQTLSPKHDRSAIRRPARPITSHIEASAGFWNTGIGAVLSSESLGIAGSQIDFKNDLGLRDSRFPELHLVVRPVRSHKLRFQYIPISCDSQTVAPRTLVFNGIKYPVGMTVNSTLSWKAYRFTCEYDVVIRDRGFGGFILDAKYTDVHARLASPVGTVQTHARAPIPALGGIIRYYVPET